MNLYINVKINLAYLWKSWIYEINPYNIQTKIKSFMEELGSKDTSIRCETEEKGENNLFFMLFAAGVVGLVMLMAALL